MNPVSGQITALIDSTKHAPGFLEVLFGEFEKEALQGAPVVLFGAGGLGEELYSTLKKHGVHPLCFCDNDDSKGGSTYCGIPVITFKELKESHRQSFIVIASHKYHEPITGQLLENGFKPERIFCKASDPAAPVIFMYAMVGTQGPLAGYKKQCGSATVLDFLLENGQSLLEAYNLLADDHSRGLFISKFAFIASDGNFELFKNFILTYSRPVLDFGLGYYEGTPEDYYYFNNDVFSVVHNEIYVDVGAYDGDTVHTFIQACRRRQVEYGWIHAFEPDPACYHALLKNTAGVERLSCNPKGLWSRSQVLRFRSSEKAIHDQAGAIDQTGDLEIQVVSLDDYLRGDYVSLVKMDPGGNVIPEAIRGAAGTIARHKPKLAVGAYHGVESMFEIPLLVHGICPEYQLFLRHSTYHLCDTDMLACL